MLRINALRKWYGSHEVLNVPSLELSEGIHWFKGVNGSGKTTFFRVLAGMLPFQGDIWLDNFHINKNPTDYRLHINYGEAEPVLPSFLTAYDLISFVSKTKKGTPQQYQQLVEQFGMESYMKQPVGTYSSGMLKKTSIVLAFLGNPKVIILDEPLVTIDTASVSVLYDLVNEKYKQGTTFLLSSHQDFRFDSLPITSYYEVGNKKIVLSEKMSE